MRTLGINGGNGVLLHPLKESLIGNIELRSVFHTKGDLQWKSNFGEIPIIKKLNKNLDLPNFDDVDIILSHPDCGHSSILAYSRAKKMGNPKENQSMTLFFKSVKEYRPKLFLMENLPKLLDTYGKEDIQNALPGYNLIWHCMSVSEFGNSQLNRVRLILIGTREDLPRYYVNIFKNVYKVNLLKKSDGLLKGLPEYEIPEICHIRERDAEMITLYAGYKDFLLNIKNEWMKDRKNEGRWKVEGKNFTTAPGVYRNRPLDYPNTIRPANRQFNKYGLMMSPREMAVIQGIPLDYILYHDTKCTDYKEKKYQINKARVTVGKTPPYEIGLWFYYQVKKIRKKLLNYNKG